MWADMHESHNKIVCRTSLRILEPKLSLEGHKLGVGRAHEKPCGGPGHGVCKDC